MSAAAAKRFYQAASVSADGVGVLLDARVLKTLGGRPLRTPSPALAAAIAAEWNAQVEHIAPASMPMTQLTFAALDVTPGRREALSGALARYIETDLCRHRAVTPAGLVERQAAAWDPIIAWAEARFHMKLPVVAGIIAGEAEPGNVTVLEWEIDDLDDFRCTALAQATELAGSILIGFALLEGRLDAETAFAAAALDDLWSLERWGEDAEARARLDRQRAEFENVARFIQTLGDST